MIVAAAFLIVFAGAAIGCWYFGSISDEQAAIWDELAAERRRLDHWASRLTVVETTKTAGELYDQATEVAADDSPSRSSAATPSRYQSWRDLQDLIGDELADRETQQHQP